MIYHRISHVNAFKFLLELAQMHLVSDEKYQGYLCWASCKLEFHFEIEYSHLLYSYGMYFLVPKIYYIKVYKNYSVSFLAFFLFSIYLILF